jgi:AcrR family transcriptional regulator
MQLQEQILNESRKLLISEGFSRMSMRRIAKEVGVSATSIYLHFKNKDELLLTLIDQSIDKLIENLEESVLNGSDPIEKLELAGREYLNFATTHPQEYEIIFSVRPEEMPKYPKEKFQNIRRGYELMAGIIEEGIEKEFIEEENPLLAAYTIWSQLHGAVSVILNQRLDTRIDREKFLQHALEHSIDGFVSRKIKV